MNVTINRLDPNVPDPVESRRRAAGRLVRIAYATAVFGVVGFFVIYFGAPFVFLRGPGTVSASRHFVSLPYTVQVTKMNVEAGATIKAGEEIAEVISPDQDRIVATYMQALADITGRTAELRIKARVAQESLETARSYLRVTEEAAQRIDTMSAATVTFRMEVLRERAQARKAVVAQEAEVAESDIQLASLDEFIKHADLDGEGVHGEGRGAGKAIGRGCAARRPSPRISRDRRRGAAVANGWRGCRRRLLETPRLCSGCSGKPAPNGSTPSRAPADRP